MLLGRLQAAFSSLRLLTFPERWPRFAPGAWKPVGYSNLGVAYLDQGGGREAKASFEQALQRDNSAEAHNNLGVAAFYQHEYGA